MEHIAPHGVDDAAADDDHEPREPVGEPRGEDVQHDHQRGVVQHAREIDPAAPELHRVDGETRDVRSGEREQIAADRQQHRKEQQELIPHEVRQKTREDRGLFHFGLCVRLHARTASFPSASSSAMLRSPICDSPIYRYSGQDAISSSCVPMPMTLPSSSTRIFSACRMELTRWATMIFVASLWCRRISSRRRESVL